jgi:hypothetical protein
VSARVSWRGDRQSSNEAEREDDVGRRSAVRPGRRTRRTTNRSAHVDEDDGGAIKERRARSASPVSALREPSRRCDEESSSKQQQQAAASSSKQHDDVGRQEARRPERLTPISTARRLRRCPYDGDSSLIGSLSVVRWRRHRTIKTRPE